jgi:hypothetical protein
MKIERNRSSIRMTHGAKLVVVATLNWSNNIMPIAVHLSFIFVNEKIGYGC